MGRKLDFDLTHGCMISPFITLLLFCSFSVRRKKVSVADMKNGRIHITFRRWLTSELQTCWNLIQTDVQNFELQNTEDVILLKLEKNRKFSVKSLYNALTRSDAGPSNKMIWKGKVPQKIKIFIWLMTNNAV